MKRQESLFEVDASAQDRIREGVAKEGSNWTGVSGMCAWEDPDDLAGYWQKEREQNNEEVPPPMTHQPNVPLLEGQVQSLLRERTFEEMHIKFNMESGSVLPLALRLVAYWLDAHVQVYIHVQVQVHVQVQMHMYVQVYIQVQFTCTSVHSCTDAHIPVYIHVQMCMCKCTSMYNAPVLVYIHVQMHTYASINIKYKLTCTS